MIGRDITITHPNFSGRITIHAYAIKMNTGIGISSKWDSHWILLIQVNPLLINYTTTERKLFIIVENLQDNYVPSY